MPYISKTRVLDVLGIDVSPLALKVSPQRGILDTLECSITQVNAKLGHFDTILLLGNNFGLMANPRRARWLLKRFYAMTPSNGRIIAASNDPYETEDAVHLAYHERNRRRRRMAGQLRIRVRYRQLKDRWFDYLMVSKGEMEETILGTGWQISSYIDSTRALYVAVIDKEG